MVGMVGMVRMVGMVGMVRNGRNGRNGGMAGMVGMVGMVGMAEWPEWSEWLEWRNGWNGRNGRMAGSFRQGTSRCQSSSVMFEIGVVSPVRSPTRSYIIECVALRRVTNPLYKINHNGGMVTE